MVLSISNGTTWSHSHIIYMFVIFLSHYMKPWINVYHSHLKYLIFAFLNWLYIHYSYKVDSDNGKKFCFQAEHFVVFYSIRIKSVIWDTSLYYLVVKKKKIIGMIQISIIESHWNRFQKGISFSYQLLMHWKILQDLFSHFELAHLPECCTCVSMNGVSIVQIMACHLYGTKLLSKTMLDYYQLDTWEQSSVKL